MDRCHVYTCVDDLVFAGNDPRDIDWLLDNMVVGKPTLPSRPMPLLTLNPRVPAQSHNELTYHDDYRRADIEYNYRYMVRADEILNTAEIGKTNVTTGSLGTGPHVRSQKHEFIGCQALCLQLYPPPTSYQAKHPRTDRGATDNYFMALHKDPSNLDKLPPYQAKHPRTDRGATDNYCMALHKDPSNLDKLPPIGWAIPPQLGPLLSSNYFMALHKEPSNPDKLRPIGMGAALRRVFAIAVKGGLDFMVDVARTQLHRFVSCPDPSRALLLLDIKNMFNEVSRVAVRDFLVESPEFSCLVPLYDLLYSTPNKCHYFDDNNDLQYFLQQEGHAQGCPIAPTMSVFNLCLLLKLALHLPIQSSKKL
eukprot:Sro14_g010511.1  (364) ;mRNA; f:70576-71733